MGLGILIFKFKDTFLIYIQNVGIQVLVIPLMLPAVSHVDMAVQKIFRPVLLHKLPKYLEALVGQVPSVIELVSRGMGHKDIKPSLPKKLEPQFLDALPHLFLCVLVGTRLDRKSVV